MHICCAYVMYSRREKAPFSDLGFVPIGLSYISGALKQAGHTTEGFCNTLNISVDELFDKLEKKPDIFAVTVPSVYALTKTKELLADIKRRFKDAKIIVGGFYARILPESIIFDKNVDAVCIGEGEKAAVEYVRQAEKGIYEKADNLWIKQPDGSILKCDRSVFVEDIDSVTMDRQIWEKWFENGNLKKYFIIAQRGCYNQCVYCANNAIAQKSEGKYLRYRNIDSIIKELEEVREKFPKVDTVEFNADNIFSDMDYFYRLCDKLKIFNAAGEKKFKFEITGNCTPGLLEKHKDIVKRLKEVNIKKVYFSLESGSLDIRTKINRPYYANEDIIDFCLMLKKEKITTYVSIMYCYPFETAESCKETLQCIKKCKPDIIQLTFLRSLPHTRLNEYMERNGIPSITLSDIYRYIKFAVKLKIKKREILTFIDDIKNDFLIQRLSKKKKKYKNTAKFYFDRCDFKNAEKALNKLAEIDGSPWIYGDLAIAKMNMLDYKGAMEYFNMAVTGEKKEVYLQKMEECRARLKEEKQN